MNMRVYVVRTMSNRGQESRPPREKKENKYNEWFSTKQWDVDKNRANENLLE